jgi:predicted 2-oxoglutarate/Fe(II)-dependent dioxygenase YbiX/peroxiredoxin
MQVASPLAPGDRVPDFILSDPSGSRRQFYNEVTGRPLVLVAASGAARGPLGDRLSSLFAEASAFRDAGAELIAVVGGAQGDIRALAESLGSGVAVFADGGGEVLRGLLAPEPPRFPETQAFQPELASYLLDPNQRVIDVMRRAPRAEHGPRLLDALETWNRSRESERVLTGGAPVLMLPAVLDPDFCGELIDLWRKEHHEGGFSTGEANLYDAERKKTLEHVVRDQEMNKRLSLTLARRIGPELAKVFNYTAAFRFDGHIVMCYQPERRDFFGLHRDNLRNRNRRRFASSLNLNDDFEGGGLYFPEYSPHGYHMRTGTACVFSCALLHRALPVTRGRRWVLTSFFCDPDQADPNIPDGRRRQMRV